MRVVLDTNSLLASIAKKSKYRPIFDGILRGKFTVLISNEILSEYTEIIERKASPVVAANISELLVQAKSVEKIEIFSSGYCYSVMKMTINLLIALSVEMQTS